MMFNYVDLPGFFPLLSHLFQLMHYNQRKKNAHVISVCRSREDPGHRTGPAGPGRHCECEGNAGRFNAVGRVWRDSLRISWQRESPCIRSPSMPVSGSGSFSARIGSNQNGRLMSSANTTLYTKTTPGIEKKNRIVLIFSKVHGSAKKRFFSHNDYVNDQNKYSKRYRYGMRLFFSKSDV
jgi:hypothetical protein